MHNVLYCKKNFLTLDLEDTVEQREKKQLERAKKHALNSSMIQELKEEYLDTPIEVNHGSVRQAEVSKRQKARQEYALKLNFTPHPTHPPITVLICL